MSGFTQAKEPELLTRNPDRENLGILCLIITLNTCEGCKKEGITPTRGYAILRLLIIHFRLLASHKKEYPTILPFVVAPSPERSSASYSQISQALENLEFFRKG